MNVSPENFPARIWPVLFLFVAAASAGICPRASAEDLNERFAREVAAAKVPEDSGIEPINPAEWEAIKMDAVTLGAAYGHADIFLLRSTYTVSWQEERLVDVVIFSLGSIAYRYVNDAVALSSPKNYVDTTFVLRDITGDGAPEIIFQSGKQGESDFVRVFHVVSWVRDTAFPDGNALLDISGGKFRRSTHEYFDWLLYGNELYAVATEPLEPWWGGSSSAYPFYQYLLYRWEPQSGTFMAAQSVRSSRQFISGESAYKDDLELVKRKLTLYRQYCDK